MLSKICYDERGPDKSGPLSSIRVGECAILDRFSK